MNLARETRRAPLIGALLLGTLLLSAPAPARAQRLYWLDTNYGVPTLNRSDGNGFGVSSVALGAGTLPEGLAAEPSGNLYFTESAWTGARVFRGAFNLTQLMPVVSGGSSLRGIAVDQASQLIYWVSSNLTGASIWRASVTGAGAMQLAALLPGSNPRGLAIDKAGGKLYWTDFDQSAIYRANLDGTNIQLWIPTPFGAGPYGIAIDAMNGTTYWTEYSSGTIHSTPTGTVGNAIIVSGLIDPTYIALDQVNGLMYWADGDGTNQHLNRANLFGGSRIILPPPLATYGGLAFTSPTALAAPEPGLPTDFALDLWPIPARGPVHVAFALPKSGMVRIRIYDLQGREIARLADDVLDAGGYERVWNGAAGGRLAPAGIYLVKMESGGRSWNRRLVLTP